MTNVDDTLLNKNSSLKSLNQTKKEQPLSKFSDSNLHIIDTPDVSKREILTYSPEEKSLINLKTPILNSANITERNKPINWTEQNNNNNNKKKKKNN